MNTTDDLGNDEALNETYVVNGKTLGVRTHAKYTLAFSSGQDRSRAFEVIRKHYLWEQHPLQVFTAIQRITEEHHLGDVGSSLEGREIMLEGLQSKLRLNKIDEIYLRLLGNSTRRALMTIAGSDSATLSDALEIAVQICNIANFYVRDIDVQKECRARTNVEDVLLDGQPATLTSPRRERGKV
jgi:hypothetical protein